MMNTVYHFWRHDDVWMAFDNQEGVRLATLEMKTGPIDQDIVLAIEDATECLAYSLYKAADYRVVSNRLDHTTGHNYMDRRTEYDTQAVYEAYVANMDRRAGDRE
jgi:hypothetical protein